MTRSIARHLCDGRATCQNYIAPKIDFIWLYMKLLSLKICMSVCIAGFPACVCLKPDADVNCEVLCCFLQMDLYGLLGTVHVLLFGTYMTVRYKKSRWYMVGQLNRFVLCIVLYWCTSMKYCQQGLHPSLYLLVNCAWWDWPLTWLTNHHPSVLWRRLCLSGVLLLCTSSLELSRDIHKIAKHFQ